MILLDLGEGVNARRPRCERVAGSRSEWWPLQWADLGRNRAMALV
jgi:hypothetical protein